MITLLIDVTFKFSGKGALQIIHDLLFQLVVIVAVGCVAFVVPPEKVPQLRGIEALTPHVTALLLAWIPIQLVILTLTALLHQKLGFTAILLGLRGMIGVVAYFGVLLLTAPEAYEEIKRMLAPPGGGFAPPPGGFQQPPPQGGFGPGPGGYGQGQP